MTAQRFSFRNTAYSGMCAVADRAYSYMDALRAISAEIRKANYFSPPGFHTMLFSR
jgi:hypothetical protein